MTEDEIIKYLDHCIQTWRIRKGAGSPIAEYYIDAYQSVRVTITGKVLP